MKAGALLRQGRERRAARGLHLPVWGMRLDLRWAGWLGAFLLLSLLALAAFPQVFAPYDPTERLGRPLEAPGAQFRLGTNDVGQDILSELVWGTRVSLSTGLIVAALAVTLGVLVGVITGYVPGLLSEFLLRLVDLILILPFLPLVILISAYLGPNRLYLILVLVLFSWAMPARLIRSRVLALAREPFVEAARALGAGRVHILWAHIWPGVRDLALVQFVLVASAAILAEASLSFLGLGDPAAKSWGGMLFFARASGAFLTDAWQWWVFPTGGMISLAILSLVLIGFALEQKVRVS